MPDAIGVPLRLNSLSFIVFLGVVVAAFFLAPKALRWLVVLAASIYFYATWVRPAAVVGVLALTLWAYLAAAGMTKLPAYRKQLCAAGILLTLGTLTILKYAGTLAAVVSAILGTPRVAGGTGTASTVAWYLPVGYSFITFSLVSYIIDVYRGKLYPASLTNLAAFVLFFPKLLAGPIERATHFLPQWKQRSFDLTLASEGIYLVMWGLFKKVVIADRLALFVDKAFAAPAFATPAELVVAVYFFAFQIYCDFSGYTDIAIGAFKFFGFNLAPNFQRPYLSRSIPEFWGRRWHISLGSWFRDYLFIPLGGSRVPLWRTLINLMVVFTVSGLWHAGLVGSAVSLPFVVWGALNGLYQVVSVGTRGLREGVVRRLPWLRRLSAIQGIGVVQGLATFHLITLGWIFFRAASIRDAWAVMLRIGLNAARLPMLFSFYRYRDFEFITSIALILVLLLLETIDERKPMWQRLQSAPPYIRWGYGYLLAVVLIVLGKWGAATFIYMQF